MDEFIDKYKIVKCANWDGVKPESKDKLEVKTQQDKEETHTEEKQTLNFEFDIDIYKCVNICKCEDECSIECEIMKKAIVKNKQEINRVLINSCFDYITQKNYIETFKFDVSGNKISMMVVIDNTKRKGNKKFEFSIDRDITGKFYKNIIYRDDKKTFTIIEVLLD